MYVLEFLATESLHAQGQVSRRITFPKEGKLWNQLHFGILSCLVFKTMYVCKNY